MSLLSMQFNGHLPNCAGNLLLDNSGRNKLKHIFSFEVRVLFQQSIVQFFCLNDMQFTSELICTCLLISVVNLTIAQGAGIQFAKVITHLFQWPGVLKQYLFCVNVLNFNLPKKRNKNKSVNQMFNSLNLYPP